jgi:putative CocE/NonD family hydrolase
VASHLPHQRLSRIGRAGQPGEYGDRFVTVQASIRGTGASGGTFSPWEPRTWQDGYEIIEDWIVRQPWSDGKVGIHGFSWPGLLGFLTASTQPPSLKAVCVGGLIDDFLPRDQLSRRRAE